MPTGTTFFADIAGSLRAVSAGVDPVGFFTRHADDPHPIRVMFPRLGAVQFFGSEVAARDLLSLPPDSCAAPTPNPIEPIVGSGSLILQSGPTHRQERTLLMLKPTFQAGQVREYAEVIGAVTADRMLSEDLGSAGSGTLDQRRTLLAAGHETTATALTWALYRIHRYDDVRRQLLAALDDRPTPA